MLGGLNDIKMVKSVSQRRQKGIKIHLFLYKSVNLMHLFIVKNVFYRPLFVVKSVVLLHLFVAFCVIWVYTALIKGAKYEKICRRAPGILEK